MAAEATADMTTLQLMIADDFVGTAFGPGVLSQADVVPAEGGSDNRMLKSSLTESSVRIFGNAVVVMGSVAVEAQTREARGSRLCFRKRPLGSQMIAPHMSRAGE